jgi:hypothetical protein
MILVFFLLLRLVILKIRNALTYYWTVYIRYLSNVTFRRFYNIIIVFPASGNYQLYRCFRCKCIRFVSLFLFSNTFSIKAHEGQKWAITCTKDLYSTAVAPGTVGTVPTVPLFLAGTANRTTIWTEKNYF